MKVFFTLTVLLLLSAAALAGGEVQLDRFTVKSENNTMVLEWEARVEIAVVEYEVLRSTRHTNGQFTRVHTVAAHGAGRPYRFLDDQVYKSGSEEQVDYKLFAVTTDGVRTELESRSVNYTSTAVRRTWGTLKAMFL